MDRIMQCPVGASLALREGPDFLGAGWARTPLDVAAHERVLDDAVGDVVRRQAEAGIDVVDDGEMGKASWITYLYERVQRDRAPACAARGRGRLAPEPRPEGVPGVLRGVRRGVRTRGRGTVFASTQPRATALPERKLWVCTGPISTTARPCGRTSRASRLRSTASTSPTRSCRSSRRPASTGSATSTTRARRSSSSRSPTRCTRSTRASSTPASSLQVDDAVLLHEYDSILSLGGSVEDYRRWAELRIEALNHALRGHPRGPRPLPRLLRQLARPARLRPAAGRR